MNTLLKQVATPLTIFIVLRGLDNTVLKALQLYGVNHPVDGVNPVSFCNIFFFVQLISGITFLIKGRRGLKQEIINLKDHERHLLVGDAFLSRFLGPVAYYFSLNSLSVITQTLIFALILPVSSLMANWIIKESLPKTFIVSMILISSGLLLHQLSGMVNVENNNNLVGIIWSVVGVMAFSGSALTGRKIAARGLSVGLSIGMGATISALVFGILAILLFGLKHFLLLKLWWVVGVLLFYAMTISLGSELALRMAYRKSSVATVSLLGSLSIVIAVISAALLLNETIHPGSVVGVMLIITGVMLGRKRTNQNQHPDAH